ncbi:MAG TPA: hypothetical protein VMW52_11915 [Phycisphaerae bacterium]|nr:hypothetical protein [Phycisphaerae bacterium]
MADSRPTVTGFDLKLYVDAKGYLVISTRERPELFALDGTADFTLEAPLCEVVKAHVQFIVGEVDVDIPLAQIVAERAGGGV